MEFVAPAPTTCACTCTTTDAGACGADVTVLAGATCGRTVGTYPAGSTCTNTGLTLALGDGIEAVQTESLPTCSGPSQIVTKPTFDAGRTRVCVSNATVVCDYHKFCAPTGGAAVCIAHAGSSACPAGFRVQMASGGNDSRDCSACTCGTTGGNCVGKLTLTTNGGCNQGVQVFDYDGGCISVGTNTGTWSKIDVTAGTPLGACYGVPGTPTGTVTPQDPITVCCN
jgi:hypothetical protein